jgi:spore maturation protein CgeB
MKIVIFGLTITSSWGNGHATTFRALCRALHARGHRIEFIEKDVEWYASHRDLHNPDYCRVSLYSEWHVDGRPLALRLASNADVILLGSYFPDAIEATRVLLDSVTAPVTFYDIDTPITLAALRASGRTEYLEAELIPHYAAYLSFTGGPVLQELESRFGARLTAPLYCSVDATYYHPTPARQQYTCDLSYLGTYALDRQLKLMQLLNTPASRLMYEDFLVAGSMYPTETHWAPNVKLLAHLAPAEHPPFYSSARFSLNITREEMVRAGYSPSVRLFEAAACGATILSDTWPGLEMFLQPGDEILTVTGAEDVIHALCDLEEAERLAIGRRARERVLTSHTSEHRAREFEQIVARIGQSNHLITTEQRS